MSTAVDVAKKAAGPLTALLFLAYLVAHDVWGFELSQETLVVAGIAASGFDGFFSKLTGWRRAKPEG